MGLQESGSMDKKSVRRLLQACQLIERGWAFSKKSGGPLLFREDIEILPESSQVLEEKKNIPGITG